MKLANIVLASMLTLPLFILSAPVFAAAAHNIQSGTHTSNVYDTQVSEILKQRR